MNPCSFKLGKPDLLSGFDVIRITFVYFKEFIPDEVYLVTHSTGLERRGQVESMNGEEEWWHCLTETLQRVSGQR